MHTTLLFVVAKGVIQGVSKIKTFMNTFGFPKSGEVFFETPCRSGFLFSLTQVFFKGARMAYISQRKGVLRFSKMTKLYYL